MDAPPPLPRKGLSPFLLIALLLVLLAVGVRTFLGAEEGVAGPPGPRLALVVAGILAALTAMIFSMVALISRRRGWPLAIFAGLAGLGLAGLLFGELREPLENLAANVKHSAAPGVALAEKAIPQKKGGVTAAAVQPSLVAWGEESMVRPYQEHGHHDAAWDDDALQLIRGTVLELTGSPVSPGPEHLRVLGAKILHTACDDPWLLFLIRRLGPRDSDHREAMEAAAAAIAQAGYPPFAIWLAQAEAVSAARLEDPDAAQALATASLKNLHAALAAKPLAEVDYRVWCALFLQNVGDGLLKQDGEGVCGGVDSIPGAQQWFRLWMRGRAEIEQAWLARGTGWATTVTPEGWQNFEAHLTTARETLEQALTLQPKQPEIARALLTVELGSAGLAEMRRRFDTAVQAQFDYIPAYNTFRSGLRPRWFGSAEAVLAFGRKCLATQRFDTEVPWQMVRAVKDVADDSDDDFEYYRHTAPWKDLQAVIDGYLAHGDPARHNYYLSQRAVLAEKCGVAAVVADSLRQLNYQIDPQVMEDWNLPVKWLGRTATYCGPACHLIATAEDQERAHTGQALQSLLAAQKIPQLLPATTDYLAGRVVEVQALIALNAAPWRPLTPPQDLAGWKVGSGEWKVVSPTVLEVTTGSSGALLTRLEPIGDTWELRGEFQFTTRQAVRTEAALFCGPPGGQEPHGFSLRFWTTPHGPSGISLAGGPRDQAISKQPDYPQATPFFARMAEHRLRVSAGNGLWLADQPLPDGTKIEPGAQLSLGSTTLRAGGTVQFHNLEWRVPGQEN